jgi:hypothetical protein
MKKALAIFCLQCVEYSMSIFCFLCIPVMYLFRRTLFSGEGGGIRAPLCGCVVLLVMYFVKQVVEPGDFGFSRWMSGFVDIIGLPVLIPFVVCLLFILYKNISFKNFDFAKFTLLWLIPLAISLAIKESSPPSPIPLLLVPTLWIFQTIGIAFFISCMVRWTRWYVIIPSALGIIALPIAATTSWWEFFSHQTFHGFLFLFMCFIPAMVSIIVQYYSIGKGRTLSMDDRPDNAIMSRSSPNATPENG